MKVFLDDLRETPAGWVRAYWPEEVNCLLEACNVDEVSLDHDLGDDAHGTGYDVIVWIEEAVAIGGFTPPRIIVHSANSAAAARMEAGIRAIEALVKARPKPPTNTQR
ncbi:cyclic-phosphate processing receiver domain-containing protein [Paraburkholderia sp. DGU8]|uniref:cyclic-phosphate processing receiver domain-containing protein n=1 Tax=Paraburkholderia sp. DGU8 TaxID=3161997 RepID=UPI0034674ECE